MGRLSILATGTLGLALLLGACVGAGDDDPAARATARDEAGSHDPRKPGAANDRALLDEPEATAPGTPPTSTNAEAPAGSLEELEQRWTEQRAAIVRRAEEEGWGIGGDNVLRGAGGLEVDLNDCPADWDPHAGVESDTLTVAIVGGVNLGLGVFPFVALTRPERIDRINHHGGVAGLTFVQDHYEDGYRPAATMEQVDLLLVGPQPFAVSTYGSPTTAAVASRLADACVPNMLVVAGHEVATAGPWATPFGVPRPYSTEAALWGEAIIHQRQGGGPPAKVALLVMDNDFGWGLRDGFQHWADQHPDVVESVAVISHDPGAQQLDDEIRRLVDEEPDVVIAATAGQPCLLIHRSDEIAELDLLAAITPSFCWQPETYLDPAGPAADGWLSIPNGSDTPPQDVANPVWERWVDDELTSYGLDPTAEGYRTGMDHGWLQQQLLELAAELPGGLSRPNLLLALWGADFEHPGYGPDRPWRVDGPRRWSPSETGVLTRWNAERSRWERVTSLAVEGESPFCVVVEGLCQFE